MLWTEAGTESQAFSPRRGICLWGGPACRACWFSPTPTGGRASVHLPLGWVDVDRLCWPQGVFGAARDPRAGWTWSHEEGRVGKARGRNSHLEKQATDAALPGYSHPHRKRLLSEM